MGILTSRTVNKSYFPQLLFIFILFKLGNKTLWHNNCEMPTIIRRALVDKEFTRLLVYVFSAQGYIILNYITQNIKYWLSSGICFKIKLFQEKQTVN